MKILKKLLFISAAMFCFSMAASAQNPNKTPVPKGTPPVIVVKPKDDNKPKDDKPKNDNKKPNTMSLDLPRKVIIESV